MEQHVTTQKALSAIRTKAVIWDMGGVLVRTEDPAPRQALAERLGMTRAELETLVFAGESGSRAQRGEITYEEHWENLRRYFGFSPQQMQDFSTEFWKGDHIDASLVDYIRSLRSRYKTGLLSNAFSDLRGIITQGWHIDDAFDVMIISAEEGLAKPDPRIYLLALERLGVEPSEAIFIDDFLHNVEGARLVGLQAVHFQDPHQARMDVEHLLNGRHHDRS
jgi:epoxide hydrolase-like predicted phosphatase